MEPDNYPDVASKLTHRTILKPYNMTKGEKFNLAFSILSALSLLLAIVFNLFRTQLFGVIKGYAPHNFGFNLRIFVPLILLSLITAIISIIWVNNRWRNRKSKILKRITVILNFPAIIFLILLLFNLFMIMRK
jgi:hypothetical protein